MKILKIFVVLLVTITTLISCERDDICIDEITPYFIIRFYDADNPEFYKKVVDIKVELEGVDGFYTDDGTTITSFTDSIAIPVKVTEDFTKFKLTVSKIDEADNLYENQDDIELHYTRENVYVSRSCGYKTMYYDVSITLNEDEDNWIKTLEPTEDPLNIVNQEAAHVKIYH